MALSVFTQLRGDPEKAESLMQEAIDAFQEIGCRFEAAFAQGVTGWLLHDQGRFAESRSAGEESAQILEDLAREQDSMIGTSLWLSAAEMHLGLHERARERLQSYLPMLGLANKVGVGLAHLYLAELDMVTGAYSQAEALLRQSLPELRARPAQVCEVLSALACDALKRGQKAQARGYVVEAMRNASDPDHWEIKPPVHPLTAAVLFLRDEGQVERAVELWALASRYPFVHNSQWFHEIAGRDILAAAEDLPPEVVEAARERGRARDLWETARELLEELERDR
jgi:tetratricopeptide (TPR) repeat protein